MSQPNIAAIESGRRAVSHDVLERLLRAADYRPSIPLERVASKVVASGLERGLGDIRVFGSAARGDDHFDSDIDLLVRVDAGRGYLDVAMFADTVRQLTGFPVDVIVEGPHSSFIDAAEPVAL